MVRLNTGCLIGLKLNFGCSKNKQLDFLDNPFYVSIRSISQRYSNGELMLLKMQISRRKVSKFKIKILSKKPSE